MDDNRMDTPEERLAVTRSDGPLVHCREDSVLTAEETGCFRGFFEEHGLSEELFLFFDSLVKLSTDTDRFMYVKVFDWEDLIGLGMFARIEGYSLYKSLNGDLKKHASLERLGNMMTSTVYFSMHAVSSPGLPRSFLYTDERVEDRVNQAILSWARTKKDADTVIIFDCAGSGELYSRNGFACLPFSSDSWLDVPRYEKIEDYLAQHKRTRKNLGKFKRRRKVEVETLRGQVPEEVMQGMIECLVCSARYSKASLPIGDFLGANLLRTALFSSESFIHFVIRVDGRIAGFSTRLLCGRTLIGIIGGYNRELSGNLPVYDFMIETTLDYCIRNGFTRLVFGLVDNHTKARLMDSFREQKFYFYAGNPLLRLLLKGGYRFLSAYDLHKIDVAAREKRNAAPAMRKQA